MISSLSVIMSDCAKTPVNQTNVPTSSLTNQLLLLPSAANGVYIWNCQFVKICDINYFNTFRFLWRIRLSSSSTVRLNCWGMKDEVDVEVVSKFMFSVRPVGVCRTQPCLLLVYTQHCMKVNRNSLVANRLSF